MKYYSEKLDKMFDTADQLLEEEALAAKKEASEKSLKENCETAIKVAEELVKEAEIEFDVAQTQVAQLQEEYDAKVDAIMEPARKKLQSCIEQRNNCIKNYNEKFGPYVQVQYGKDVYGNWPKIFNQFLSELGL